MRKGEAEVVQNSDKSSCSTISAEAAEWCCRREFCPLLRWKGLFFVASAS